MRAKKGFTIVEIVIALAVISLVSITATSLVIFNQNLSDSTRDKFFAVNMCDNSIELLESVAHSDVSSLDELYAKYKTGYSRLIGKELPALEDGKAFVYMDRDWDQTTESSDITCALEFRLVGDAAVRLSVAIYKDEVVLYNSEYTVTMGGAS